MKTLCVGAVVALIALPAHASCDSQAEMIFECTLSDGGKQVQVCYSKGIAYYAFGRPNQTPELELQSRIEDVFYLPWNGIGRSIYEEVGFTNGDFDYTVYAAQDRMVLEDDPQDPLSGGITVTSGDEVVADLQCDANSVARSLDVLHDYKEAAGQCWSYETFEWSTDCPRN